MQSGLSCIRAIRDRLSLESKFHHGINMMPPSCDCLDPPICRGMESRVQQHAELQPSYHLEVHGGIKERT